MADLAVLPIVIMVLMVPVGNPTRLLASSPSAMVRITFSPDLMSLVMVFKLSASAVMVGATPSTVGSAVVSILAMVVLANAVTPVASLMLLISSVFRVTSSRVMAPLLPALMV